MQTPHGGASLGVKMFTRNKPHTDELSNRVGGPTQLKLERPRPMIPPLQVHDYDNGPEEYAPPDRREQDIGLLHKLDEALSVKPVDRVKQDICALTYGEMIEVAGCVAKNLQCSVEAVANALHEFGKS